MQNLDKIEKIFGMIGSDSDGETLNAVALIKRSLKSQGKNWNDLSKHLFGAAPRASGTNQGFKDRWHDMAEEMRAEREEKRRRDARAQRGAEENNRRAREEKPHANNGKYSYGDPYPGYSEHKKMALELVNIIITKNSTMTQWETSFIQDIYNKNICMARSLSSKQESILQRIYEQYIKS